MDVNVVALTVSVAGSIIVAIRWMVKYYLKELTPNHGTSLKDQVTRIENRQDKQDEKIDRILFLLAGENNE